MATTREIFDSTKYLFRPVPMESLVGVCYLCLGAVQSQYSQCYSCKRLFFDSGCPSTLRRRVVPMTVAENRSEWYSELLTYKGTQFREYGATLASLAYEWIKAHKSRLRDMFDEDEREGDGKSPFDYITVVPSKKGKTYEQQPLRRALALVTPVRDRMREVLRCTTPRVQRLTDYDPSVFETVADVEGDRVLLVEDTWITGATALSAAGNLIEAGARSVVIAPIAREVNLAFHQDRSPEYLGYLDSEYDLESWPRP